ncbi:hypothetical protein [Bacillus sp. JCM 19041]|uniref:hypothetical protein n=1 Tax=Bacillus sp. JCM 19041 TaxID=1460637 RepID=UPI0006D1E2E8
MAVAIDDLVERLREHGLEDILEMVEDAEAGKLEEIELVKSIGLLYDQDDNKRLLEWFEEQGVTLVYVTDDEE